MTALVIFDFSEDSATQINDGSLGSNCNGTAVDKYRISLPSEADAWQFSSATDEGYITTPHYAGIDDMSNVTFEFCVQYLSAGGGGAGRLFSKAQTYGNFGFYFSATGNVVVERGTTNSNYEQWTSAATFAPSSSRWYDVQVTWASGTGPTNTAPICYVNNVATTMTRTLTGTGNWSPDAAAGIYIGNRAGLTRGFSGKMTMVRVHNAILDATACSNSYNSDRWRWENVEMPRPNATANVRTPTVVINQSRTEVMAQSDADATVRTPTVVRISNPTEVMSQSDADANVRTPTVAIRQDRTVTMSRPNATANVLSLHAGSGDMTALVIFDFSEDSPNQINDGSLGSNTNGTAVDKYRYSLPSGADAWQFDSSTDQGYVTTPHYAGIDNMTDMTFEFCVRYLAAGGGGAGRLFSKAQTYGRFDVYFLSGTGIGNVVVERGTTNSNYEQWTSADSFAQLQSRWYDVQLTWASGTGPTNTAPVCYVNNVETTMTRTMTGTGNWSPDAANGIYIGNRAGLTRGFSGGMTMVRIYNSILYDTEREDNYYADKWRWENIAMSQSNAAANVRAPTVVRISNPTEVMSRSNATATPRTPTIAIRQDRIEAMTQSDADATVLTPTVLIRQDRIEAMTQSDADANVYAPTIIRVSNPTEVMPRSNATADVLDPTIAIRQDRIEAMTQSDADATVRTPTVVINQSRTEAMSQSDADANVYAPTIVRVSNPTEVMPQSNATATPAAPTVLIRQDRIEAMTQSDADANVYAPTIVRISNPTEGMSRSNADANVRTPAVLIRQDRTITLSQPNADANVRAPEDLISQDQTEVMAQSNATANVLAPSVIRVSNPTEVMSRSNADATVLAPTIIRVSNPTEVMVRSNATANVLTPTVVKISNPTEVMSQSNATANVRTPTVAIHQDRTVTVSCPNAVANALSLTAIREMPPNINYNRIEVTYPTNTVRLNSVDVANKTVRLTATDNSDYNRIEVTYPTNTVRLNSVDVENKTVRLTATDISDKTIRMAAINSNRVRINAIFKPLIRLDATIDETLVGCTW